MSITPDSISKFVDNSICQLLSKEASAKYTRDTPLMQLGLSSLQLMELRALLAWEFSIELAPTFFFQAITAQDAIDYLIKNKLEVYKDWLYEIQWKETNAPKPQKLIPNQLWLIFTEKNTEIGQTLFEELKKNEQLCLSISPGNHFEKVDEHHYTIAPNNPHDFTQLLLSISELPQLAAVVYLWGYQGLQTDATFAAIETYMKHSCGGLVNLVNSLATAHVPEEAKLWIVAQSIVSDGNTLSLVQTSLNALSKVIREEYSKSNSSFLALDSEDTNKRQVELLLQELAGKSSEPQIAWKKGTRHVTRMVPTAIQSVQNVRFSDKATYLIAGGHRPLGLRLARWHIEHGAKTLVLLDENPLTPQIEAEIEELKALGADIHSYVVPFDNLAILQLVFKAIQTDLPPLKGVIHSAGVVDNDLLLHMDWSRFEQTHRLKIAGSWNLHVLTEKLDLDHFILFSAAMADLAPLGKASSVTGNTFLDALSYYRKNKGLPSLTIDWAPWESKLIVLHHLIDNSLSSRMKLITIEEGLKVLESLFYTNKTQVMAVQVEWSMLLSRLIRENPLFEEMAKKFELIPTATKTVAESNEPIAIIGMACRFPGAKNYREFWENLVNKVDSIREIPPDRWDWKGIYGDPKTESGKTNVKWGGFIEDIDKFDPLFFNISPKEAAYIDPQHRIFLQTVWHAMEDAGYSSEKIAGQKIGVYAGVSKNDYAELMRENAVEIAPYTSTGTVHSILTNRVSYLLDLHGPSESVDTACSSALVALHSAIRDLRNGECDLAFVGGVNTIISPTMYISHTLSGMLSDDGHCKTFDENANGYVRAEGVGVLLIKPLREALKDGDSIHAVIRGVAINHGGKSVGLTAPSVSAQAEVVQSALRDANIDPEMISCIEVHGTGTPLGDPIEIDGLKKAFASAPQGMRCVLSAVKSNIGHLESAAGIAGIIKMVLELKNHAIPPILNFNKLNPRIDLKDTPFTLATTHQDWNPIDKDNFPISRFGGVSCFGMGGTNGHVILEESPLDEKEIKTTISKTAFPVSAKKGRLHAYVKELADYIDWSIEKKIPLDLESVAYTLQTGRDSLKEKVVFMATNLKELRDEIREFLKETFVQNENPIEVTQKWADPKPKKWSGLPGYPFEPLRCWFEGKGQVVPTSHELVIGKYKDQDMPIDYTTQKTSSPTNEKLVTTESQVRLTEQTEEYLKTLLTSITGILSRDIDSHEGFENYGVDSIVAIEFSTRLKRIFGSLPNKLILEHSNISQLAGYFIENYKEKLLQSFENKTIDGFQVSAETGSLVSQKPSSQAYPGSNLNKYAKLIFNLKPTLIKTSKGIEIELIQAGKGTTIVLLPPWGCLATAWCHQFAELTKKYHVISIHYPGCGNSEFYKFKDFKDLSELIIEILDNAGIKDPFHLVGWSKGGLVAQFIASKIPGRIKTLTFVSSAAMLDEKGRDVQEAIKLLQANFLQSKMESDEEKGISIDEINGISSAEVQSYYYLSDNSINNINLVEKINIPTLIIAGGKDNIYPLTYSKILAEAIKNSLLHIIPAGGHYIPLFSSEEFNKVFLQFIENKLN